MAEAVQSNFNSDIKLRAIGRITSSGQISQQDFATLTNDDTNGLTIGPDNWITVGPDHALWFTENDSDHIGRFAPADSSNSTTTNTPGVPATVAVYQAIIPGPGCDTKGGVWDQPINATVKCLRNQGKMLLTHGPNLHDIGQVTFNEYSNQAFPPNVEVSVQIDGLTAGCAGVLTRGNNFPGYGFEICADDSWVIYAYSPVDGTSTALLAGNVSPSSTYTLTASSIGQNEALTVNNTEVGSVGDSTNLQGAYVGLIVDDSVSANSATFSHFVFTELP
jgi:hypothetical protein